MFPLLKCYSWPLLYLRWISAMISSLVFLIPFCLRGICSTRQLLHCKSGQVVPLLKAFQSLPITLKSKPCLRTGLYSGLRCLSNFLCFYTPSVPFAPAGLASFSSLDRFFSFHRSLHWLNLLRSDPCSFKRGPPWLPKHTKKSHIPPPGIICLVPLPHFLSGSVCVKRSYFLFSLLADSPFSGVSSLGSETLFCFRCLVLGPGPGSWCSFLVGCSHLWIHSQPVFFPSVSWFSCSVGSNSLWFYGLQHTRLPCPSPTPRVCSDSCPSSQWCHPTISSSVVPFSSWPKYWSFSIRISLSNEYSGLISFRTNWFDLLVVQGTLKCLL